MSSDGGEIPIISDFLKVDDLTFTIQPPQS
jgi:hypothetical protein